MIGNPGFLNLADGATSDAAVARIRARVEEIRREVRGQGGSVERLLAILDETGRSADARRDALSTQAMDLFRQFRSRAAFGLLYELNGHHLLQQVIGRLRRYQSHADPQDVLQEVFVNVYRYPQRFNAEREDAFRVWTATIVRNTVLKYLRSLSRNGRAEVPFDDLPEPSGGERGEPLRGAIESESENECGRVYLTYLHLYLRFYGMLSEREQRAIHLVEVDGLSYRAAAEQLGIKLENLKMVIFRARRKIHRSMRRVFEGLPPDLRPARDPKRGSASRLRASGAEPTVSSGFAKDVEQ